MADVTFVPSRNIDREELIAELRALKPFFVREGVTRVALIGSRARRDNRPDSDIDLVIEVDPDRKLSLLDLIGIKHVVEDRVGLSTDLIMRRALSPDFRARVDRDGVEVF